MPRAWIGDRTGFDAPATAIGVPAVVDRPQLAVCVADVEDISIAVNEEVSLFTVGLFLHHLVHLTERRLDDLFAAELGDDRSIYRGFHELVDA